jgi:hypothetical protein
MEVFIAVYFVGLSGFPPDSLVTAIMRSGLFPGAAGRVPAQPDDPKGEQT